MYGNGKHALADAMDIVTAELEILIDRNFAANRTLVVEPEGGNWTATLSGAVLYRSANRDAVVRFALAFQAKTDGIEIQYVDVEPQVFSVRVPKLAIVQ